MPHPNAPASVARRIARRWLLAGKLCLHGRTPREGCVSCVYRARRMAYAADVVVREEYRAFCSRWSLHQPPQAPLEAV